jgi:hypothetical protein
MGLMVRRARVPPRPASIPETFPALVTPYSRGNPRDRPTRSNAFLSGFCPSPLPSRRSLTQLRSPDPVLSHPQTKADAGISAFPDGDNIFNWVGTIEGAAGTVRLDPSHRARRARLLPSRVT